ncbi:MAG: hypothetical protein ACI8YQ_003088 [Polaribacter sp.]|jgi:hypothetical protein
MLKQILLIVILSIGLFSCNSSVKTSGTTGVEYFGAKIDDKNVMPYAKLVSEMGTNDSLAVKVKGRVAEVCQAKGCWMSIVEEGKEDMFVKFKDYGFFMPLDISGKEVIMEGYAFREVTSVEELQHYAEDEGKSPEEIAAITQPEEELKFMASGVILLND